jgi:predicted aldo/keto reductase-like oxidoreductase
MTDHHGRDRQTVMRMLEESLKRLKTDHLDLWQVHDFLKDKSSRPVAQEGSAALVNSECAPCESSPSVRFAGYDNHVFYGIEFRYIHNQLASADKMSLCHITRPVILTPAVRCWISDLTR